MSSPPPEILRALGVERGDVLAFRLAHGSTFAAVGSLTTARGRYFVKFERAATAVIDGEAASLAEIRKYAKDLTPTVRAVSDPGAAPAFLVTDYLDLAPLSAAAGDLGAAVARLHQASMAAGLPYGLGGVTTCCGPTPQPNPPTDTWLEFFREHRLQYIFDRIAHSLPSIVDAEWARLRTAVLGRVVPRLLAGLPAANPAYAAALVHGDLWAGNAACAGIRPVIYDPSSAYADPEFEFGVLTLFGGFPPAFFDAYRAVLPPWTPAAEHDDRVALYRLYHLLNHTDIFGGGGYESSARSTMRSLVAKYAD
ncbi:Ketosamine-3-kinase [Dipodascopsis tothii]|uniref:Ketosamine-3-kinase n=1 Tax=Dipodascopsis tothii TaxID=44089 RepID=UPI0034CE7AFB